MMGDALGLEARRRKLKFEILCKTLSNKLSFFVVIDLPSGLFGSSIFTAQQFSVQPQLEVLLSLTLELHKH